MTYDSLYNVPYYTTEKKWDIVVEIIKYIDDNYETYGNVDVNLYEDSEGSNILVFDSTNSKEKFNDLVKNMLFVESIELVEPTWNTNSCDFYIEEITEGRWTYSDEGYVCDGCGKWHNFENMNGVGYANYHVFDGYVLCENCIKKDPDDYVDALLDNPDRANTILNSDDLYNLNFNKINKYHFENGMYGDNDNPKKILAKAKEEYPDMEFIFSIRKIYNPFTTQFDLYGRDMELVGYDKETGKYFNHYTEV